MRAPFQVLVIPYKIENKKILYGVFLRENIKIWQAISGGGEDTETPFQTAKRESNEEANISYNAEYIKLDSISSIPVKSITGEFTWGKDVYVVKEYSIGVNAKKEEIKLSNEHKSMMWVTYDEAIKVLKYDSNKTALFELNERLLRDI